MSVIPFLFLIMTASAAAQSQPGPEAEFHMARLVYASNQGQRAWRPWWAIDYPEAEFHLTRGLSRLTNLDVAEDSRHLRLTDPAIFDYPWLFAQQPGRWLLDSEEIDQLREYVGRGGFVVIDDFHGEFDWQVMSDALRRAFPDWPIVRRSTLRG